MKNKKVIVYGIDGCPYCTDMKTRLTEMKIPFTYVDANLPENITETDKVFEAAKSDSVPIVRVGNQLLVPEVSFQSIDEGANLVKRFLND